MKLNSIIIILFGLLLLSGCSKDITAKPMPDIPPIQNQTINDSQSKELVFPEIIENYKFITKNKQSDCDSLEEVGYPGIELCQENYHLQYQNDYNKTVFVILSKITKGLEQGKEYVTANFSNRIEFIDGQKVYRIENHELIWFPKSDFDMIAVQESKVEKDSTGESYYYENASTDNPVLKQFLSIYSTE